MSRGPFLLCCLLARAAADAAEAPSCRTVRLAGGRLDARHGHDRAHCLVLEGLGYQVIAVRAMTGEPMLVLGADGRLAGVIDEPEILRALVHEGSAGTGSCCVSSHSPSSPA